MAFEHLARLGENRLNLTWEDVRLFGERVYRFRAFDLKDSQESEIVANCMGSKDAARQEEVVHNATSRHRQQQPECRFFLGHM